MVELILNESGVTLFRPQLKELQDSFKKPIDEFLKMLPGNRVLSGFIITDNEDGTMTTTAGLLVYNSKIYSIAAYTGPISNFVSFFSETRTALFNVGTEENPVIEPRPSAINRTAQIGNITENEGVLPIVNLIRGRKLMEYLKTGTTFIGPVIVSPVGSVVSINFPEISTSEYIVIGNFKPSDSEISFTQNFDWTVKTKSKTGFRVIINNSQLNSTPLLFDWVLVAINRPQPTLIID